MSFDAQIAAAVVMLVTGIVLFLWGVYQVRTRQPGPRGQLMMWGGVAILLIGGFASPTGIGFFMVIGGFALLGQALAEVVRARRERNRPPRR